MSLAEHKVDDWYDAVSKVTYSDGTVGEYKDVLRMLAIRSAHYHGRTKSKLHSTFDHEVHGHTVYVFEIPGVWPKCVADVCMYQLTFAYDSYGNENDDLQWHRLSPSELAIAIGFYSRLLVTRWCMNEVVSAAVRLMMAGRAEGHVKILKSCECHTEEWMDDCMSCKYACEYPEIPLEWNEWDELITAVQNAAIDDHWKNVILYLTSAQLELQVDGAGRRPGWSRIDWNGPWSRWKNMGVLIESEFNAIMCRSTDSNTDPHQFMIRYDQGDICIRRKMPAITCNYCGAFVDGVCCWGCGVLSGERVQQQKYCSEMQCVIVLELTEVDYNKWISIKTTVHRVLMMNECENIAWCSNHTYAKILRIIPIDHRKRIQVPVVTTYNYDCWRGGELEEETIVFDSEGFDEDGFEIEWDLSECDWFVEN